MPTHPMYPMLFLYTTYGRYYYTTYCCDANDPHDAYGVFKKLLDASELGCPVTSMASVSGNAQGMGIAANPVEVTRFVSSQTLPVGFGEGPFPPLAKNPAEIRKNGEARFGPSCRELKRTENVRLVTGHGDSVENRLFTLRQIEITFPGKRQILIADSPRVLDESVTGIKSISITGLKTESDGRTIEVGLALTEDKEPLVIVNQFPYA